MGISITGLRSFYADITCGEGCWSAKSDVCVCSCAGKNHGIKRTENGGTPERTAKIDGYMYKLAFAGLRFEAYDVAEKINNAQGFSNVSTTVGTSYENGERIDRSHTYHYRYRETEKGSPARVKPATKDQILKWSELTAFRAAPGEWQDAEAYLCWIRAEMPEKVTCNCGNCPNWFD